MDARGVAQAPACCALISPQPDENLEWAVAPPSSGFHALITTGDVAVGYMRWQIVDRETLDSVGLADVPSNALDIDLHPW